MTKKSYIIQRRLCFVGLGLFVFSVLLLFTCRGESAEGIDTASGRVVDRAALAMESIPEFQLRLDETNSLQLRIENNVSHWLLRAARANPAILSVFDLRDRLPRSDHYYVPWVGEFVGKFLTNAILTLQATGDPELEKTISIMVEELISKQSPEGYLGPFPKEHRLLVGWDLWGHYHCLTALLMWHERTGDKASLDCAMQTADFLCDTFLNTDKRMKDAGAHEMNLSIITALCELYRLTGKERYWQMVGEIEKDWETTGDFFRQGLAGVEFYKTPLPRWESIHNIIALTRLYQITGNPQYKEAFLNLWHSTRKLEMHNNGSFTSGEQTVGNPYEDGAIETCCTIAWMVMTVDALRLSGDSTIADALENSTYNAAMSLGHPSGSWSTYDTPMDGRREASFHSIVFQSRPGQPELNCCSVNAPRGLAMLSQWAVMKSDDAITVNYYGQGNYRASLGDNNITLQQTTNYPKEGDIVIAVTPAKPQEMTLRFRIPLWATGAAVIAPGESTAVPVTPGGYFSIKRLWQSGDTVKLHFPMNLRYESGDLARNGKISIFRGPLLLAYDQRFNDFEADEIPVLAPDILTQATVELPDRDLRGEYVGRYTPWLLVTLPVTDPTGKPLVLCDFGTAGTLGSSYRSWLPARSIVPAIPACETPREGEKIAPGAIRFSWRKMTDKQIRFALVIAATPDFVHPLISTTTEDHRELFLTAEQTSILEPDTNYYWKVIAINQTGYTESLGPARRFQIDSTLPAATLDSFLSKRLKRNNSDPNMLLIADQLAGKPEPTAGELLSVTGALPATGPAGTDETAVALNGQNGMVVYSIAEFPVEEFSVSLRFCVDDFHKDQQNSQIICAWCRPIDDPIRVGISPNRRLYGAVEGARGGRTPDIYIEPGKWYQLGVIKEGTTWSLYLDGELKGKFQTEEEMTTSCEAIGLGGNPKLTGSSEFLPCRVSDFRFYGRALPEEELFR